MDSEIIDAVTGWDSAPAERGYGGLRSLADDGFSGAVVAGMTWGFMLNGRLLGVFDGTIADFDDESFEAYRAPDPSLPLLYTMQETGGDVRAQYYSEDTPLSDADGTLSAGGFTGYVELSENVLSGDYYVVYHGGKSMNVAFVGNSKRLVTGDEAFELAADEIGIYKVYDVDVDLVEIPDAAETTGDETADEDAAVAAGGADVDDRPDSSSDADSDSDAGSRPEPEPEATSEPESDLDSESDLDTDSTTDSPVVERAETPAEEPSTADETAASSGAQADESSQTAVSSAPDTGPEAQVPDAEEGTDAETAGRPAGAAAATETKNGSSSPAAEDADGDDPFSAEAEWRNARSIPSLDPRDAEGETPKERPGNSRRSKQGPRRPKRSRSGSSQQSRSSGESSRTSKESETQSQQSQQSTPTSAVSAGKVQSLREELADLKSERDRLASERDSLRTERDEYRERAEELERRVDELETELESIRTELDENGVTLSERSMPADEALRGTNLFVRYKKKSGATLEKAHAGQAKQDDVVENLRLEHHTTFDTDGLGVDGKPYEEFLHETPEYGFAKWAVTDLLYEIGETGNRSSLAGVFDSIPEADRIELYGSVSVPIGEDETESRRFDVIFRDQMGNPLFVANLNDSRDPATYAMVQQLINDSKAVAEANETLGSAFAVTKSFFEPEALEAATEETGGGILSRSKRKSFVKLSRKQGYHLCLVEARSGEFHLNVPDL